MPQLGGAGAYNRRSRPVGELSGSMICHLAGDDHENSKTALRLQTLSERGVPAKLGELLAYLAWGEGR